MSKSHKIGPFLGGGLAVLLASAAPTPAPGATIFVNAQLASGANDGSSWANAFQGRLGLQSALTIAQAGDELWVARGVYAPASMNGDPLVSFTVPSGVAALGGFLGNETQSSQRNPAANATTLTGDLNSNDVPGQSATLTDNSFHVVRLSAAAAGTTLDGFIIEKGFAGPRAGGINPDAREGGGILITGGAPILRNCTIRDNQAGSLGGGVSISGGSALLEDCAFTRNKGSSSGGNLGSSQNAATTVRRCSFVDPNYSTNGTIGIGISSGFRVQSVVDPGTSIVVEDCFFSIQHGQFLASNGVAINIVDGAATIRRSRFIRCTTSGGGGGVSGGRFSPGSTANITIDRCMFAQCEAEADGGAAIYAANGSTYTITNSVFTGNDRAHFGFATIFMQGVSLALTNCTMFANSSADGFHPALITTGAGAHLDIRNCIIWGNPGGNPPGTVIRNQGGAIVSVDRSLVQNWAGQFPGVGTINANPLFIDADGPDNIAGTEDDGLRLSPGSPAIDRGDNAFIPAGIALDFAGQSRRRDDPATADTGAGAPPVVDAGAHEFFIPCVGDADGDLMIGLADIAGVIQSWGSIASPPGSGADFDSSGDIGLGDIAIVIQMWGVVCP